MSLLTPGDQQKLRATFAEMTRPVRLLFFTQAFDCDTCATTRQILDELPPLSDKISIEEINLVLEREKAQQYGVDRVPTVVLVSQDEAGVERDSRGAVGLRVRISRPCRAARGRRWLGAQRREPCPCRGCRQARDDAGVHHADLTALPAGGQPRARDGVR